MGDMLLTSDQMKMFTDDPNLSRTYIVHTNWLWTKNWSKTENKYLIPFMVHPVRETQGGFRFQQKSIFTHISDINKNLKD